MNVIDFNGKPILISDMEETVSFTVHLRGYTHSTVSQNSFTYTKKAFELTEQESNLVIAEFLKQQNIQDGQ